MTNTVGKYYFLKFFATKWLNLNNRGRKAHGKKK